MSYNSELNFSRPKSRPSNIQRPSASNSIFHGRNGRNGSQTIDVNPYRRKPAASPLRLVILFTTDKDYDFFLLTPNRSTANHRLIFLSSSNMC